MNPMQSPNVGPAGSDFGNKDKEPGPPQTPKITPFEASLLANLRAAGTVYWSRVSAKETAAMRRLVRKGMAVETTGHAGKICWIIPV